MAQQLRWRWRRRQKAPYQRCLTSPPPPWWSCQCPPPAATATTTAVSTGAELCMSVQQPSHGACAWVARVRRHVRHLDRSSHPAIATTGALDLSKLGVTVQAPAVAVLSAGANGGTWTSGRQQAGKIRRPPRPLSYNATPAEVEDAVWDYAGLAVNVTLENAARVGLHSAPVWHLTLPNWGPSSVTALAQLVPEPASGFSSGAVLEYEFSAGAPPGSGTICVVCGDGCESVVLNVADDPLDVIGAKLASLPGVAPPVRVAQSQWFCRNHRNVRRGCRSSHLTAPSWWSTPRRP
ncbi:hypothetical protein Vretifemale_15261 [Volvox reticuliferus]|uniref:Uncharacterized protein n=1 Tax=Volvox reticuliferus TaxID=1737510 RepID=A0A8J4CP43_9CHLO|nr:hypothetical protein Vretifemale_15261 [Volvox reticuliferus]